MPVFSIITPSYNSALYISDTITSVISQSYTDWEMIIVDDFSTDRSLDIIMDYSQQDSRIKIIRHSENSGVAIARNTAIEKAKGRYITFLDSDDQWLPHKLELQLEQFKKGADVVYSSYYRFFEDNTEKLVTVPEIIDYKNLLLGNCIGNLTGAYNADTLGKFYQKEVGHEDYLMWLSIVKKSGYGVGLQVPLARYRVGKESLSSSKIKSAQWTWNIYRKHLKLSLFKSIYSFSGYAFNSIFKRF